MTNATLENNTVVASSTTPPSANVNIKALSNVLSNLTRILLRSKNASRVTQLIKLEFEDGEIQLTGVGEIGGGRGKGNYSERQAMVLTHTLKADVQGSGVMLVSPAALAALLKGRKDYTVHLTMGTDGLVIKFPSSGGKSILRYELDPSEFRVKPIFEGEVFEVDAEELTRAVSSVRHAVATEAFQAVFRSIRLELGATCRAVAADGFRMAYCGFEATGGGREEGVLLPAKALDEAVRWIKGETTVRLSIIKEGNSSFLVIASKELLSKIELMNGEFPYYERVIPKEFKLTVQTDGAGLREVINRVKVAVDRTSNNATDLEVKNNFLTASAENDNGEAHEVVQVTQSGVDTEIKTRINAEYLTDALGPIKGIATIDFSGDVTPLRIHALISGQEYVAIVVPLRKDR